MAVIARADIYKKNTLWFDEFIVRYARSEWAISVESLTNDRRFRTQFGFGMQLTCDLNGSSQNFTLKLPSGTTHDITGGGFFNPGITLYANFEFEVRVSGDIGQVGGSTIHVNHTFKLGEDKYQSLGSYTCE